MICELVSHYRDNPAVIGWQLDNETGPNGAANPAIFADFVRHLQAKFATPEALDRAWFLNYWGQAIHQWSDMPRPDFTVSPSYELEWARFQQSRVTAYLSWQKSLVRSLARADQFVLHDFASAMRSDVNELAVARQRGWSTGANHVLGEIKPCRGLRAVDVDQIDFRVEVIADVDEPVRLKLHGRAGALVRAQRRHAARRAARREMRRAMILVSVV